MTGPSPLLRLLLGATLCLLPLGCGQSKDDAQATALKDTAPARARNGRLTREGFTVKPIDLNRDGQPDQFEVSGGSGALRVERDMNFDGFIDLWEHLDAAGHVSEAEIDIDFDHKVDVVVFYRPDGSIEHKELALNFSDTFTVFKYYGAASDLLRIEYDEDGDGRIERWDYFENKRLARTGWDQNGDGVPDTFDDI